MLGSTAMLDFRRGQKDRERQDAAMRQRLVVLVLGAGVLFVVIGWIRDPRVCQGLDRLVGGGADAAAPGSSRPAPPRPKEFPPGEFLLASAVKDAKPRAVAQSEASPRSDTARNSRDVLRDLGVADRYWDRLHDDRPIDAAETETLLRVMYALRVLPAADLDRWAEQDVREAIGRPQAFRGSILKLRGRVLAVERLKPSPDAAERFEMASYYRCSLQLDPSGDRVTVYTEHVPDAWRKGGPLDAPGGAVGVFLKVAGAAKDAQAVFAAPRLAWYADDLLGQLGMDAGLLDAVKDQRGLTSSDQPAFYAMLAAAGRTAPGELLHRAEAALPDVPKTGRWTDPNGKELYSVAPLFEAPAAHRGKLFCFQGAARRVEKIHIDDPAIVARYGFDHYYQVSLFTGDCELKLVRGDLALAADKPSQEELVLPYPLTFCVRELPDGMPCGTARSYAESIRVAGFFFKMWRYPVAKISDSTVPSKYALGGQQLSPLLIGRSLVWQSGEKAAGPTLDRATIIGALVAVVLVVLIVAWQWRRGERRHEQLVVGESPQFELNDDAGETTDREVGDRPDFSRLAALDDEPDAESRIP